MGTNTMFLPLPLASPAFAVSSSTSQLYKRMNLCHYTSSVS